jgi:hypothetical protein
MSYCYRIYGLQIESTVALNGLFPGSPDLLPDISIDWHKDESALFNYTVQWREKSQLGAKESEIVSFWEASTVNGELLKLRYAIDDINVDFILDYGWRRISVVKPDYIKPGRLKSYLLGSVLSSILRARGTLCLHASVVEIDGRAIAFMGPKSAGKSTTAAALVQYGASILTDDIAAITSADGHFQVQPGYMYVRLLRGSVNALYSEADIKPRPGLENDKMHIGLSNDGSGYGTFCPEQMPLSCIFQLEPRSVSAVTTVVSRVEPKDRFMMLFQNVYGFFLSKDSTYAHEFKTITQLANSTPIYRMQRLDDIDKLAIVCETILENIDSPKIV